jgi:putative ABC transport system permease protein
MAGWRYVFRRLRALWRADKIHDEIAEEMRFHIDLRTEENVRRGMAPEAARREAERQFGHFTSLKEQGYEVRGGRGLEATWQDLRYGARLLAKNPGFAAVAVLTLGLGIGANTAIFSVVNAVLLRPLSFENPDQLVMIWQTNPQRGILQDLVSPPNLHDWQQQSHTFGQIAAFNPRGFSLTGTGEPEVLPGTFVSVELFPMLGANPLLGRNFLPDEGRPGGNRAVIISFALWQRRFGGDPDLLGKSLTLNGAIYTVVGIMPAKFQFPVQGLFPIPVSELWAPLAIDPAGVNRGNRDLFTIGRLQPGVSIEEAQAEMATIAQRLAEQYPDSNRGMGVHIVGFHQQLTGNLRAALLILLGAVVFVLLIACANVANLLLARSATRQRELAIRTALGAGRSRLMRQLLTESVLLSLLGGALGLALALWNFDAIVAALPAHMPRAAEIQVDRQVLVFTFAVAVMTGVIFGLVPALQASSLNLNESLKESGGKGTGGFVRHRVRTLLVVTEVALALILLVGAGLLIKSFHRLQQVNAGFNPQNVLSVPFVLPQSRYPDGNARVAFINRIMEKMKAMPGVQAVGGVTTMPLSGDHASSSFIVEGQTVSPEGRNVANMRAATPDYFRVMSIPIVKGRGFTEQDHFDAPTVVIINESFERLYFPDEEPIGKRVISPASSDGIPMTIVGVAGDVRNGGPEDEPRPEFYYSYFQNPIRFMFMAIRTAAEPSGLIPAIRREIWSEDNDLPLANISTLEQLLSKTIAQRRFNLLLLGLFSGLALVLAVVGIYGVVSYAVTQRTHEIGIRLALGAQQGDVRKLVIRQGMIPVVVGIAIGLSGALALTRLMKSLLFGVSATDPLTFVGLSLLLIVVALAACWIPARRATKVDPLLALRHE